MKGLRKKLNKILAMFMAVTCFCMCCTVSAFAMEEKTAAQSIQSTVEDTTPLSVTRSPNVTFTGSEVTFTLSKNISRFDYSSGATSLSPSSGFVLVRFTNVETGSYCTHSLGVPSGGGYNNCNMTAGTYKITQVGGTSNLSYYIYLSF